MFPCLPCTDLPSVSACFVFLLPPGVPDMSEEELRAELASRAKALQRRLANLTSVGASEKVGRVCCLQVLPGGCS